MPTSPKSTQSPLLHASNKPSMVSAISQIMPIRLIFALSALSALFAVFALSALSTLSALFALSARFALSALFALFLHLLLLYSSLARIICSRIPPFFRKSAFTHSRYFLSITSSLWRPDGRVLSEWFRW